MPSQTQRPPNSEREGAGSDANDRRMLDERFTELYDKIRRLAARVRWNGSNSTLNPTALAHEAYLKLQKDPPDLATKSYDEIIAIFSNAMRQILIDAARRKGAQKRIVSSRGEMADLPIEDAITVTATLEKLEHENPAQARIVQCRFLLGMTVDETAAALGISKRTVERQWQEAKARLLSEINPGNM
jgi:RNA polymerase sigma factor (TIGR02999 family)